MESFVQNFFKLYFMYVLDLQSSFEPCIFVLLESSFVCMILWMPIAEKIGKKNVFYVGSVLFSIALFTLFIMPANNFQLIFAVSVMAGPGIAVIRALLMMTLGGSGR